jgi:hypothetical protein
MRGAKVALRSTGHKICFGANSDTVSALLLGSRLIDNWLRLNG